MRKGGNFSKKKKNIMTSSKDCQRAEIAGNLSYLLGIIIQQVTEVYQVQSLVTLPKAYAWFESVGT